MANSLVGLYNENVPEQFQIGGTVIPKPFALYKDYLDGKNVTEEAQKNYDNLTEFIIMKRRQIR